jgi:hypothetical protein
LGRESYEYMYARPWSRVVDFYAELVGAGAGAAGLAKLFRKDEVRKNKHLAPLWYWQFFPIRSVAR